MTVHACRSALTPERLPPVPGSQVRSAPDFSSRLVTLSGPSRRRQRGAVMVEYVWVLAFTLAITISLGFAAPSIVANYAHQRAILYAKDP